MPSVFSMALRSVAALSLLVLVAGSVLPQELPERDIDSRAPKASVITHCTVPNTAAITFDDGPYNYIYDISKTLKANNAVGTFFFNGNNYGCIYSTENAKRVKYVYDQGHQVASHTWAHSHLDRLSRAQVTDQMQRTDQAIQRITGALPAFMRPPYGGYNNMVLEVAATRKQAVVIWDFDSGDSAGATASKQKTSYKAIASKRPNTILTLNHETYASSAYDVLPAAIKALKAKNYKLVTVAQCLGKAPYQSVGKPAARTSAWKC